MTSLEKAINLGYLFLTFKPGKKTIKTCTTFFCMYWYVSIYSEECFWPQFMYPKLISNNGYRWYPLGKLSRRGWNNSYVTIYWGWTGTASHSTNSAATVIWGSFINSSPTNSPSSHFRSRVVFICNRDDFLHHMHLESLWCLYELSTGGRIRFIFRANTRFRGGSQHILFLVSNPDLLAALYILVRNSSWIARKLDLYLICVCSILIISDVVYFQVRDFVDQIVSGFIYCQIRDFVDQIVRLCCLLSNLWLFQSDTNSWFSVEWMYQEWCYLIRLLLHHYFIDIFSNLHVGWWCMILVILICYGIIHFRPIPILLIFYACAFIRCIQVFE